MAYFNYFAKRKMPTNIEVSFLQIVGPEQTKSAISNIFSNIVQESVFEFLILI